MNIYITILSIFFLPNGANVCSCATIGNWRKATPKEYKYVEDVFIGDVKKIGESKFDYEIEVCEVFKGDLKVGQIIKGTNPRYCSPFVDKLGEWVLFGEYSTDFKTNDCGLSSNIAEPFGMFPPPPPPKPNSDTDSKELIKKWRIESKKNILEQINMLRNISE
jgi:hypothetical protein